MVWLIYAVVVLAISGAVGLHLGRFREAYTEMTGMMTGMTMGMLNGFVLGYAAAAATNSMFWGNLFGILLGLSLGAYFGRAGSLMGIMDGGMGGVMGGSMGAMLAVMVAFPQWGQLWTAVLLSLLYIAGIVGLVVLIEQSAPQHAALHRLLPMFTRAINIEVAEAAEANQRAEDAVRTRTEASAMPRPKPVVDYYRFLGIAEDATDDDITEAYYAKLDEGDEAVAQRAERAYAILSDHDRREAYNRRLNASGGNTEAKGQRGMSAPPKPKNAATLTTTNVTPHANSTSASTPNVLAASVPARVATGRSEKEVRVAVEKQTSRREGRGKQAHQDTQTVENSPARKQGQGQQRSKQQAQQPVRSTRKGSQPAQKSGSSVGPMIGGALVVLLLAGSIAMWLFSQHGADGVGGQAADNNGGLPADVVAKLDAKAVIAPIGQDGRQTLDVAVNGDTRGYQPSVIKVKQGMPVHFNLSVVGADPG